MRRAARRYVRGFVSRAGGLTGPFIASVVPPNVVQGSGATGIAINGANFDPSATVEINGVVESSVWVSDLLMTSTVPASLVNGTPGSYSVQVINPGPVVSNLASFDVLFAVPTLTLLSPSTQTRDISGSPVTITLTGTGFLNTGTVARVNGSPVATTYVSPTSLQIAHPVTAAGTWSVTVFNPAPGGGESSSQTFSITNAAPTLASLSPTSATRDTGGSPVTVTCNGSGYYPDSVVHVDGSPVATTYVSPTAVTFTRPITSAVSQSITVVNPSPGGGTSGAQTWTVTNAAPTLSSISPVTAPQGSGAVSVTCTGTGFYPDSTVHVNGSPVTTTYVSPTSLTFDLDTSVAGAKSTTVVNPSPGGGTSGAQTFTVVGADAVKRYRDPIWQGGQKANGYALLTIFHGQTELAFTSEFF